MAKISKNSRITLVSEVIWRKVENEAVILNLETDKYYTLNLQGTDIWAMCGSKKTVKEIISKMTAKYNVKEAQLLNDVIKLTKEWEKEGLVKVF